VVLFIFQIYNLLVIYLSQHYTRKRKIDLILGFFN
jgi:hypothetical protein